MRSKVKRLTEKPDKDPAKLPRTEKEQDMVCLRDFLHNTDDISPTGSFLTIRGSSVSPLNLDNDTDLGVPSPPKALNGIRQRLGLGLDEDGLNTGAGIGTEDDLDTVAGSGSGSEENLTTGAGSEDDSPLSTPRGRRTRRTLLARTASIISSYSTLLSPRRDSDFIEDDEEHDDIPTTQSSPTRPSDEARSFTSSGASTTSANDLRSISSIYSAQSTSTLRPSVGDSASTRGGTWPRQKNIPNTQSRPFFFQPSELEEIMAPVKADFMQNQADKLEQAKAAYEQLNEQLMSELPQLIDLRCVFVVSLRWNCLCDELDTNDFNFQPGSPTSTPHSKPSSKSNYASARKRTAAWRKCNSTSMLPPATSMPAAISMHGWRTCWARFGS